MSLTVTLHSIRQAHAVLSRCSLGAVHRTWMSVRDGSSVWVTRDAARLESAGFEDLVDSTLHRKNGSEELLSSSLRLHRAIYLDTHHRALLETTPPRALALTVGAAGVVGLLQGQSVPLLEADAPVERIAAALRRSAVVLVRGSRALSAAQDLESAARLMCQLEERATVMTTPRPPKCG